MLHCKPPTPVWYIGTEAESDDVLPRTEVSFNNSMRAELEAGTLYLNGAAFASFSEIVRQVDGSTEETQFVLEPGRVVYNTLELCNFVHRCVAIQPSPAILIRKFITLLAISIVTVVCC